MQVYAYEGGLFVKDLLRLFATLSDPTRLRLLRLVQRQELCVCELMDALRCRNIKSPGTSA